MRSKFLQVHLYNYPRSGRSGSQEIWRCYDLTITNQQVSRFPRPHACPKLGRPFINRGLANGTPWEMRWERRWPRPKGSSLYVACTGWLVSSITTRLSQCFIIHKTLPVSYFSIKVRSTINSMYVFFDIFFIIYLLISAIVKNIACDHYNIRWIRFIR